MDEALQRKWEARYRDAAVGDTAAATVLSEYTHLLPARGTALELACGLGANALLLARCGLATSAWDIAPSAVAKLQRYAREQGLALRAEVRDVLAAPPRPATFDVIVVSRFLERRLAPCLLRALRPGGLLFYETFIRAAAGSDGPSNPAFRLAPNELLHLFAGLRVVFYREEGRLGDTRRGVRDVAQFIGRRA